MDADSSILLFEASFLYSKFLEITILTRFFLYANSITCSVMLYMYSKGRNSEGAKQESKYWQRFHAKAPADGGH